MNVTECMNCVWCKKSPTNRAPLKCKFKSRKGRQLYKFGVKNLQNWRPTWCPLYEIEEFKHQGDSY